MSLRPVPELDEWITKNCPPVRYSDGQTVEKGDAVDYGGRVGADGIHIDRSYPGDVYWGEVVGTSVEWNTVCVNECLNGPPRWYFPDQLTLLQRAEMPR